MIWISLLLVVGTLVSIFANISAEAPESFNQCTTSGGASRVLIGTKTPPAQGTAKKYSR